MDRGSKKKFARHITGTGEVTADANKGDRQMLDEIEEAVEARGVPD